MKPLIIGCLLLFALFSAIAGFVPTYPLFIITRFLQGCAAGPLVILATSAMNSLSSEKERTGFMEALTIVIISASVFGSCWGAIFAYEYQWQWIFHIDIFFVLLLAFGISKYLQDVKQERPPIDWVNYASYALSFLILGSFCIVGQELDWLRSSFLLGLLPLGLVCLAFFIIHRPEHPLFNLDLLKQKGFIFGLIQTAILFSSYFGMLLLLSLWLNLYVHYTITWIAAVLGMMITCTVTLMSIMSRFKFHLKLPMLLLAILLLALSCYLTTFFDSDVNLGRIATSRIIGGFGLALFLPPLLNFLLGFSKSHEGAGAVTLFQTTRALSSALGAALYATLWQRRYFFFYQRLGGDLTSFSQKTKNFFTKLRPFYLSKSESLLELNDALDRQAQALALDDCFYFMTLTLIAIFILLALYCLVQRSRRAAI